MTTITAATLIARSYIAVQDQDVGTCEALRWAALSVRPYVLASGTDAAEVTEAAIAACGHESVTLHSYEVES